MSYSKQLRLESDGGTTTRRITVESDGFGFVMRCNDARTSCSSRTECSLPSEWFRTEREAIARADEKFHASKDDGFLDMSDAVQKGTKATK